MNIYLPSPYSVYLKFRRTLYICKTFVMIMLHIISLICRVGWCQSHFLTLDELASAGQLIEAILLILPSVWKLCIWAVKWSVCFWYFCQFHGQRPWSRVRNTRFVWTIGNIGTTIIIQSSRLGAHCSKLCAVYDWSFVVDVTFPRRRLHLDVWDFTGKYAVTIEACSVIVHKTECVLLFRPFFFPRKPSASCLYIYLGNV